MSRVHRMSEWRQHTLRDESLYVAPNVLPQEEAGAYVIGCELCTSNGGCGTYTWMDRPNYVRYVTPLRLRRDVQLRTT